MPGEDVDLPPTDDDRSRVINLLRAAGGRLGLDETERRMDAAVHAPTKGDLALLVWDLPDTTGAVASVAAPRVRAWDSTLFRAHATSYVLVNGMLIGIWDLTTPHGLFWPFFPIAGWGIGLVGNAFGTRAAQRNRYRKQVRRMERRMDQLPDRPPAAIGSESSRRHPPHPHSVHPPHRQAAGRLAAGPATTASVVVMFTDVVDSTRLNLVIGDEDWARLRRRYREMLHSSYADHHGREVNTAGDGFLARFDRPGNAVRCAIDIQRRLQAQREEVGFAPAVRIGLNAGSAIEEQGDVLGTTVNLASRVTASAEPNEILVTEAVADLIGDRFELVDGGLRDLKGLDRKAHVLSVRW